VDVDQDAHSERGSRRLRLAIYGAIVFLSAALLMVLELVAARLLAPYVGVSLYTWTSIIGVVLAGLSLGSWLGGVWADRGGGDQAAGMALALAGLLSLAVLLLLTVVAPLLQASELSLLSASFLYVLTLFFLPAVSLGVITPLLTTLALRLDERQGHVVGRMHALGALGSIVGTFVAGYWLIQYLGTRVIVVGTSGMLFLLALPFLMRARRRILVVLAAGVVAVLGLTQARHGFDNPCDRESQYYCIRIVDASDSVPFGRARAMVLDHLVHGINHDSEPAMLVSPYMHAMSALVAEHFGARNTALRYFFAGGGAYTQPRAVQAAFPDAQVTVAELDPVVTDLAVARLFVDVGPMRVRHMDARMALRALEGEHFDVIVGDVFHDVAVPFHLTTQEFFELVKRRLTGDGIYVMNVVDASPDPLLVKSLVKTLGTVFRHVDVWLEEVPREPRRLTYVLSASDARRLPPKIDAQRGFRRSWIRVTQPLLAEGTPLAEAPMLEDDYVPVDRLTAPLVTTPLGL